MAWGKSGNIKGPPGSPIPAQLTPPDHTLYPLWIDTSVAAPGNITLALVDGTTITPDPTYAVNYVTIAGNRAIAAPSSRLAGQRFMMRIEQDGTGGHTITSWDPVYRFAGGITPALSAGANKSDYFGFVYNAVDSKWDNIASVGNF